MIVCLSIESELTSNFKCDFILRYHGNDGSVNKSASFA